MRRSYTLVLGGLLLVTACGRPEDLTSLASGATDTAPAASAGHTTSDVPCPTPLGYPFSRPAQTSFPPTPTPVIDAQMLPVETAPGGISSISVPNDDTIIRGIFTNMPASINDYELTEIHLGEQLHLYVQYERTGPEHSRGRFLTLRASNRDFDRPDSPLNIDPSHPENLRRDGNLVWKQLIEAEYTTAQDGSFICHPSGIDVFWSSSETPWRFSARADTRENLETLLKAFVTTVQSSPAPRPYLTPTPNPTPRSYPVPPMPNPDTPTPFLSDQPTGSAPTPTGTTTPAP